MAWRQLRLALITLLAVFLSVPVMAEKADRGEKLSLSAKRIEGEETKVVNTRVAEGDVVVTQGTMRITAERAIVKEFEDGRIVAEIFGSANSQIAFRQKREGLDSYFEAWADRAELDNNANTLKLFSRAKFKSGGDVAVGEYFFYDTVNEKYELRNQAPNAKPASGQEDGRVSFEIQPRVKNEKTEKTEKDDKAKPAGKAK